MTERRPDVSDLANERAGKSREATAEAEGQHVNTLSPHTHAGGHVAVLHYRANEQTKRSLCEDCPHTENNETGKSDH